MIRELYNSINFYVLNFPVEAVNRIIPILLLCFSSVQNFPSLVISRRRWCHADVSRPLCAATDSSAHERTAHPSEINAWGLSFHPSMPCQGSRQSLGYRSTRTLLPDKTKPTSRFCVMTIRCIAASRRQFPSLCNVCVCLSVPYTTLSRRACNSSMEKARKISQ